MKKNILFLALFCLGSTVSFAGGPNEPIQLKVETTESQLMMMPSKDESLQSEVNSEQKVLLKNDNLGCIAYAINAAYAEQAFYGTTGNHEELIHLINDYDQLCLSVDGNLSAPIFL